MTYRIARGPEVFGPYTSEEVYRLLNSGNVVPSDLAQAEGSTDWRPVSELFPVPDPATTAAAPLTLYPDPPNLPWWVALLLGIITGGLFFVIWDIVEAAWMRRI